LTNENDSDEIFSWEAAERKRLNDVLVIASECVEGGIVHPLRRVISERSQSDESARLRFLRETRVVISVRHSSLV